MGDVKLLGLWYSPFSHRVEWALKFKGVQYEFIEQDLQNKSPILLESNPIYKKVPVLIHNGKPICESIVILEYIDEVFEGPSILPKDPYNRALARFWVKFFEDKGPSMRKSILLKGEEQEKAKEEVFEMLRILDNELKGKKFFVGDKFGFVDIVANAGALWLGVLEEVSGVVLVTKEKFPNFCVWRDEYCTQNKEYLPSRDELLIHIKLLGLWYSPFSKRVEWALKTKGVEYEYIEDDLQNKSLLLLQSNPIHKKVPVLIHNGKPICESSVILEYIDETFEGPSILPKDPYDRALAPLWFGVLEEVIGVVSVTSEKFPNFCDWRDEYYIQNKEYLPSRDELFAHYQAYIQRTIHQGSQKKN
uniref:Probable glutathione S-transferase n=1 Tax=Solanum lycopersicum TaxID=4081 RepID=A0A3Q7I0A1_SOLLC